ncbi:hypothetical protein ACTWQF_10095 [Streptomyces sp. 8N114]|uniref:hypothetical protein n=1 Tax=Streptomyces sp. 8N114 TaxID=3457419 RepID=UPI003FD4838C
MNIVRHIYFGIVTREGSQYRARVEVPGGPAVVLVTDSNHDLIDDINRELADHLGVDPDEVEAHLFGHEGGNGTSIYAGASVFDGDRWYTQFPAQADLPVALLVPPSPTYEVAAEQARRQLASAVGRSEHSHDIEFFEIVPKEHAESS